jgi:hypothetical protein
MDYLMKQLSREPARVLFDTQFARVCNAATISLCAALMLLITGCGGSNAAHLQGVVTINGQPVPADAQGSVTFQPTESGKGKTMSAPLEGGHYDLPDVPLGPYRAIITVQRPTGRTIDNGRGTPAPEFENMISPDQLQGIDTTVEGDREDLNFDLKGI